MSRSPSSENPYERKSNTPALIALVLVVVAIGLVGWYAFAPTPASRTQGAVSSKE